jgi:hypothetical protein
VTSAAEARRGSGGELGEPTSAREVHVTVRPPPIRYAICGSIHSSELMGDAVIASWSS